MSADFTAKYGRWAVIAGGSDGIGLAFAHALAARGENLVIVARRDNLLEAAARELHERHGVEVRSVTLDLSRPDALAQLEQATRELEVGTFIYNAGGDTRSLPFLDKPLEEHLELVQRNCQSVLEAAYRFGRPMLARGRGAMVLVTSGAAWAGGATLSSYAASKAFDLMLAESLWAEWHPLGVDVLALVLGATDTPSLRRSFAAQGKSLGSLADPVQVVEQALAHLADGPTWIYGSAAPSGGSPFGAMARRDAVLAMSRGATQADRS
jgi:short-subunit dehydrogenase